MTVQKVIPKDTEKENEKYLIFLDYILDKLKNGRPAGISLRNLASDYKTEMGTVLDRQELKEFIQLYGGIYFDKAEESIDRLKIKDKTTKILLKYGSIRDYLKQQENQSSSLDNLKTSITINNKTTDNNIPVTIPSKKKTIFGVGVWQIIIMVFFGFLTIAAMFYIAYRQGVFE